MTNSRSRSPKVTNVILASDFTTTSTSLVDVTGFTMTALNRTGGKGILIINGTITNTTLDAIATLSILDGASVVLTTRGNASHTTASIPTLHISMCYPFNLDGQVLKLQMKTASGTAKMEGNDNVTECSFTALEWI